MGTKVLRQRALVSSLSTTAKMLEAELKCLKENIVSRKCDGGIRQSNGQFNVEEVVHLQSNNSFAALSSIIGETNIDVSKPMESERNTKGVTI
ncbi:hypothetical protein J6590_082303 [Homalodisca vitripennis]|nr:hypothetical protein J6590_082303 [Homalodisca vitripennis]